MTQAPAGQVDETRVRIVEAATRLLQEDGPAAVTTRGVAQRAGVQAPAIYRLFGDKDGLLDAVAEHVLTTYVAAKAAHVGAASAADVDPVEDLRVGWQMQIDFGVSNPALFALLSVPDRASSAAAVAGLDVLRARISRVAATGRLRVSERRAVDLVRAAGSGAVLTLLATPAEDRDLRLADDVLEAVLRQILTDADEPAQRGPVTAAVTLRARTAELHALTAAERQLLDEWLDRVIEG